ncbi:phage tail tube protein [Sphingobium sp. ZW T5_29]|uniref:phage tail tube protein n=1 Tax=Sphingobium sp. ZW T5_29 TaxID=3378077 RepID=UPI003853A671
MAYTDKLKSTQIAIMMGDGAEPEVFSPMCGLNQKQFQQTRATSDTVDWDCTDPDAIPITVRDVGAADWNLTGSGLLHRPLLPLVQAAFDSAEPTNYRWAYMDTVIDGYHQGPGIITDFTEGATNGEYVQINLTISAAGPKTFVSNP